MACGEDTFTAIAFPFQAFLTLLRFALCRRDTFFRLPHRIEANAEDSAVVAHCRVSRWPVRLLPLGRWEGAAYPVRMCSIQRIDFME